MLWMCMDCIQRREHFVWIIIIILLPPIGAVAYFFAIKNRASSSGATQGGGGTLIPFGKTEKKEVETDETLQLKELIGKYQKAYHYEKLGQAYVEQKNYDSAIANFEEAIQKDPEMLEARYGLAKCLHGLKRYDEAAAVLEKLTTLDKKYDYGNAIFGLAECYRMGGDDEKALATYGEVINSFHFFKAYYHYARLLDKNGKKQEAIDYMKSIVGSSKDLPDYKLEKERFWIDEAYKYLRKNGIELA
ncbi:MAG: tetratricopeptide repeat protein [Nitrospina sp.]|nr:tetratricopeptide repeat protein [Nitrospina sp.]MBT6718300.1 tetratricopeptide repeat protein [Nitrospina sp.]